MKKQVPDRRKAMPTIITTPAPPPELDLIIKLEKLKSDCSGDNQGNERHTGNAEIEYVIEEEISYKAKRIITYRQKSVPKQ